METTSTNQGPVELVALSRREPKRALDIACGTSVDVYLVSRVRWQPMMLGQYVVPGTVFKVGYASNPFDRLSALRTASAHNLALFGVILCADVGAARSTEVECHALLHACRKRGEWFEGDVSQAWEMLRRRFGSAALWLTEAYDVDLDAMRLTPFPKGGWSGMSDNYHRYADFKQNGITEGFLA